MVTHWGYVMTIRNIFFQMVSAMANAMEKPARAANKSYSNFTTICRRNQEQSTTPNLLNSSNINLEYRSGGGLFVCLFLLQSVISGSDIISIIIIWCLDEVSTFTSPSSQSVIAAV